MSEQSPTVPPHYSVDGAWWWDGASWHPVQPAPPPSVAPPTAPSTAEPPRPAAGDERGAASSSTGGAQFGWLTVGGLILAALVVLAGIVGASLLLYRVAGSPSPNVTATPASHASPPPASAYPYAYIGGVSVGSLTGTLRDAGFQCTNPGPASGPQLRTWRCDRTESGQREIVLIEAVDPSHVHLVDVTVVGEGGRPDPTTMQDLFRTVATAIYQPSEPAETTAAQAWAVQHEGVSATAPIGKLTLRTEATSTAELLEFDAGTR
jgi:hypothetical protein